MEDVMIIGIDFFGVYLDHLGVKLRVVQELFPHLGVETTRDVLRHRLQPRLHPEDYARIAQSIGRNIGHYPLHDGAREISLRIQQAGHRIVVVTTTTQYTAQDFFEYACERQLPLTHLHVVADDREKIERCRDADVEVFVDDNQSVLRLLRPLAIPLIWANFSGDDAPRDSDFFEARSWRELERTILERTRLRRGTARNHRSLS